jgi:hypothetical protein
MSDQSDSDRCAEVRSIHADRPVESKPPPMGCELVQQVAAKSAINFAMLEQIDRKVTRLGASLRMTNDALQKLLLKRAAKRAAPKRGKSR